MSDVIIKGNQNTTDLCNKLKADAKQYPTLDKNQEKALIEMYRNDRSKLNNLLFMHNIRLVFNLAKKYVSKTRDFDGLVQDGMRGLGEAIKRFDIDKDVKFITYATPWVKKYILANFYSKSAEIDANSISINSKIDIDSSDNSNNTIENYINEYIDPSYDKTQSFEDILSSNEQSEICKDLIRYLKKDSTLSAEEKNIFIELFNNKLMSKHVAEKMNIALDYVNSVKKTVINKFKDVLHTKYNAYSYNDLGY